MNVLLLGGTGGIGLEMVRQAIDRGHAVTALVRAPDRLGPLRDRIAIIQGDVLNSAKLEGVLGGQDAVLSGVGPRRPITEANANLLQQFAVSLTRAMLDAGTRRVILVSTAFLFKDSIIPPSYLVGRLFFGAVVADACAMERMITESSLDWAIVRPPRLTNKPHTGRYRVREGHLPGFGFTISRADVADFVIRAAESHASSRKVVGVAN
jgi:putative NADH-flavin reductase